MLTNLTTTSKEEEEKGVLTSVSFTNDVGPFIEFTRIHGIDHLVHLATVEVLQKIVLHHCIFDQLLGPVSIKYLFNSTLVDVKFHSAPSSNLCWPTRL